MMRTSKHATVIPHRENVLSESTHLPVSIAYYGTHKIMMAAVGSKNSPNKGGMWDNPVGEEMV